VTAMGTGFLLVLALLCAAASVDRDGVRLKRRAVGYGLPMPVILVSRGSRRVPSALTDRPAAPSVVHLPLAVAWLRPASTTLVDPSELLVRRPMGTQH
jgi:hypothetical protein